MNPGPDAIELTGDAREAVLSYADPIADNLLAGFNEDDYDRLARDFSEIMENQFPPAVVAQSRGLVTQKIGRYRSREPKQVFKKGPYRVVTYTAAFEHEAGVTVTLSLLDYQGTPLVAGLWFDSPKLRE